MLIQKGGISRQIDDKDLQAYREKGYSVVNQVAANKKSDKTKTEKVEKILDPQESKGE